MGFKCIQFNMCQVQILNYILQPKLLHPSIFEINTIIIICCYEIKYISKVLPNVWRLFFDNRLSAVLTKLEATHEKLVHLNVIRPMQIKMNWFFITGTIVHLVASNAPFIKWIILRYIRSDLSDIQDLVIIYIIYPVIYLTHLVEIDHFKIVLFKCFSDL